jgi:hypothetical protein
MHRFDELAGRLRSVMQAYAAKHGGAVSFAEFGDAVARAQGLGVPYSSAVVADWMDGRTAPSFAIFVAIAAVGGYESGYQRGWIAFGAEHRNHAVDEATYNRYHRLP